MTVSTSLRNVSGFDGSMKRTSATRTAGVASLTSTSSPYAFSVSKSPPHPGMKPGSRKNHARTRTAKAPETATSPADIRPRSASLREIMFLTRFARRSDEAASEAALPPSRPRMPGSTRK